MYKAPEVLRNNPITKKPKYDQKVDVWSLGVCGYQLISFELPFSDELDVRDVNVNYKNLPTDNHPKLVPLVQKMLTRDVASRPSATEMFETIKNLHQDMELQEKAGKIVD